MNGLIEVEYKGNRVMVQGGPFREVPEGIRSVKLAREINIPCDVALDIEDFSVPTVYNTMIALREAMTILEEDGVIYVGCMGGIGRTGMFIALLMRIIGAHEVLAPQRKFIFMRWWAMMFGGSIYKNETDVNYRMRTDPVEFVREHYLSHAVETQDQWHFVERFPVGEYYKKVISN
jgi:hypothetical protein